MLYAAAAAAVVRCERGKLLPAGGCGLQQRDEAGSREAESREAESKEADNKEAESSSQASSRFCPIKLVRGHSTFNTANITVCGLHAAAALDVGFANNQEGSIVRANTQFFWRLQITDQLHTRQMSGRPRIHHLAGF